MTIYPPKPFVQPRSKNKDQPSPCCPASCLEDGQRDAISLITPIIRGISTGLYSQEDGFYLLFRVREMHMQETGEDIPSAVWKRHLMNFRVPHSVERSIRQEMMTCQDFNLLFKVLCRAIPRKYQDEFIGDVTERYWLQTDNKVPWPLVRLLWRLGMMILYLRGPQILKFFIKVYHYIIA